MDIILIDALKEFGSDCVKIIGPACITAIVAFKTATEQSRQKITEIKESNRFKASTEFFNIYKGWYEELQESQNNIANSLLQINGFMISGEDFDGEQEDIMKLLKIYVHKLPFNFRKMEIEFKKRKGEFDIDYEELTKAKEMYESLPELTADNHIDYTIKLEYIYSTLAHCSRTLIIDDMHKTYSEYTTVG